MVVNILEHVAAKESDTSNKVKQYIYKMWLMDSRVTGNECHGGD